MFMHQIMIAIKQLVASYTSYATWDPTQSLNMTLSGGNLTATNTTSGTTRSTVGKSSGKWYWELTNFSAVSMVGIVKSTDPYVALTYLGQTPISYGYWQGGQIYNNGGTLGTFAGINPGDIVSFKLDMDAGTCEILRNSGSIYTITGLTGTWHAGCGINGTGLQCTANFGATAFSYAVPSGYNAGLTTQAAGGSAIFNTAGTTNWTVPVGVTSISVAMVGAGGGAGGSSYTSGNYGGAGGAGGGAYKNSISVTPGSVIAIVVGQGGARGTGGVDPNSTAGSTGTSSSYASSVLYSSAGSGGNSAYAGAAGGTGGTGTNGDVNYTGNAGPNGTTSVQAGGTPTVPAAFNLRASAGNGGSSQYGSSNTAGEAGCVRIIWGIGRAFPSTSTGIIGTEITY